MGTEMPPAVRTEVAVLVPVLGRPQRAQPLADSFAANTDPGLARLIFICTPADLEQIQACHATGHDVLVAEWPAGYADFARKVQWGYDRSVEPFIFQAADDVEFQRGWCEAALAQIGDFGVCGTWDGANPLVMRGLHSTHSLIARRYVEICGASWDGPGTVFSIAYAHQWCDSELVELAKTRGCFTFAAESRVLHRHPMYDPSVASDATYAKALADGAADSRIFQQRQVEWTRAMVAA